MDTVESDFFLLNFIFHHKFWCYKCKIRDDLFFYHSKLKSHTVGILIFTFSYAWKLKETIMTICWPSLVILSVFFKWREWKLKWQGMVIMIKVQELILCLHHFWHVQRNHYVFPFLFRFHAGCPFLIKTVHGLPCT